MKRWLFNYKEWEDLKKDILKKNHKEASKFFTSIYASGYNECRTELVGEEDFEAICMWEDQEIIDILKNNGVSDDQIDNIMYELRNEGEVHINKEEN